jgi:hypothetical protein
MKYEEEKVEERWTEIRAEKMKDMTERKKKNSIRNTEM